jgi:hypothetical protein
MQRKIACFVFAILLGAALTAAKVTFTPFSATAWPIGPSSGGEVKCLGGTPTGTFPPCTPGSKVQIRGSNRISQMVSSDPLLTGIRTGVVNANFDENGRGHMWGTWRLVLDGGRGEWEGTYTGFAHGWFGAAEGHVVGHGTQGEVDGMEVRAVFSVDEMFPFGLETDTGYRFDPKGNH